MGELASRTAGRGLRDPDPLVRLNCLEAIQTAATLLGELGEVLARDLPPAGRPPTTEELARLEQYTKEGEATLKEVAALATAMREQMPGVAACLSEKENPHVRLRASQTLAEIGYARQRISLKPYAQPATPAKDVAPKGEGAAAKQREWLRFV